MKLSTFKPALMSWLDNIFPTAEYYLDAPEYPGEVYLFVPPLRQIATRLRAPGDVEATAIQEIYYLAAYGPVRYIELPIGALEGLSQSLSLALLNTYQDLHEDILELKAIAMSEPVIVREDPTAARKWVVELSWGFELTYIPEVEAGFTGEGPIYFEPSEINVGLWKDALEGVLDQTSARKDTDLDITL